MPYKNEMFAVLNVQIPKIILKENTACLTTGDGHLKQISFRFNQL